MSTSTTEQVAERALAGDRDAQNEVVARAALEEITDLRHLLHLERGESLVAAVDALQLQNAQLRREAELNPEAGAEMLDDTRAWLLRCFPEMDRLGLAMLHQNAHKGEWNVPALAEHVAGRLMGAHTPTQEKRSEVVAQRMEELRERARQVDAARIRAVWEREKLAECARVVVRHHQDGGYESLHPEAYFALENLRAALTPTPEAADG